MGEPLIAGVGFATIGERPDLSDLDRALGRIEDAGASHAELALFAADLIAGGRVLPERAAAAGGDLRAGGACATPRTARSPSTSWTRPTSTSTRRSAGRNLELAAARRRLRAGPPSGRGPDRGRPHELDRLHAIERAAWREMGDVAGRLGLRLAVETLFVESEAEYTADPVAARRRAPGRRPSACGRHARRQPQLPDDQLSRHLVHRSRGARSRR